MWTVQGNTFEPLRNGTPGAVSVDTTITATQLLFLGNWTGDSSAAGAWLSFAGSDLTAIGNYFDTSAVPGDGIKFLDNSTGVAIMGNRFHGCNNGINLNSMSLTSTHISGQPLHLHEHGDQRRRFRRWLPGDRLGRGADPSERGDDSPRRQHPVHRREQLRPLLAKRRGLEHLLHAAAGGRGLAEPLRVTPQRADHPRDPEARPRRRPCSYAGRAPRTASSLLASARSSNAKTGGANTSIYVKESGTGNAAGWRNDNGGAL